MKKLLALVLMSAMLAMTVPVMAGALVLGTGEINATVSTGVIVPAGQGYPPVTKAQWIAVDKNPTPINDGDSTTYNRIDTSDDNPTLPGTQVNPPMQWDTVKPLEMCTVVTDPDGKGNIIESYIDVYHPDGSFKYEVRLKEVPTNTPAQRQKASDLVQSAYDNGILSLNDGYTLAQVKDNVLENSAKLFCGKSDLDYHQMCGEFKWKQVCSGCPTSCTCVWQHTDGAAYEARGFGVDVEGSGRLYFSSNFEYVCSAGIELDFNSINWENVKAWSLDRTLNTKWVEGDTIFDSCTPGQPCPACKGDQGAVNCRPPTIRNIGNTPVAIGVAFDDMKFGKSGDKWNVDFDSSIKHNKDVIMDPVSAHSMDNCSDFNPNSTTTLPDQGLSPEPYCAKVGVLDLCSTEKLTFSIHVYKAPVLDASYNGCTLIEPTPLPFPAWLHKVTCTTNADCPASMPTCTDGCCVVKPE